MAADSPDLVIAKRLLDHVKARGFQFQRVAEGPDGALLGIRNIGEWTDTLYLDGFSRDCYPGPVFFSAEDGSWCELSITSDGTRDVWEGGSRRLWTSIETAIEFWHRHGEPGWDRFGLTVTPHHHTVWLDTPDSGHHWPVP